MMEEGEADIGVKAISVSTTEVTEHVQDSSPYVDDKRTQSIAAGSSVTIDQMVRDYIIAKTVGMTGNDRNGDSVKEEKDRKGHQKSNRDKKKKKKKKKHKSHEKESSSKQRRRHHRDRRSRDASNKNSSNDDDCQHHIIDADDVVEQKDTEANRCVQNDDCKMNNGPLTSTAKNEMFEKTSATSHESVNSTEEKENVLNFGVCSTCCRQVGTVSEELKTKTDEVWCCCSRPAKVDDNIVNKNDTVLSRHKDDILSELITYKSDKECHDKSDRVQSTSCVSDSSGKLSVSEASQVKVRVSSDSHSREAMHHSHKENKSSRKDLDETRKLTKQGEKHEREVSTKSRHYVDKMSDCAKNHHSSTEHRYSRDDLSRNKPAGSRKSSPVLEKVSYKHNSLIADTKSDDVVFVKKVSAYDAHKSSSSTCNRENSNIQQKLSQRSSRSIALGNNSKHGNKHRCDSRSSEEDAPKRKVKKDTRQTKDSPVILLSDDDVDVLSDEMMEKLHKRLTTSIKKSKELQAERELNLVANLKTDESSNSHNSELIEEPVCCDTAEIQNGVASTMPISEISLPADSGTSHGESASTSEQSAVKSTASGSFGKKTLKFGLKISETSAAWISKGIKSSQASDAAEGDEKLKEASGVSLISPDVCPSIGNESKIDQTAGKIDKDSVMMKESDADEEETSKDSDKTHISPVKDTAEVNDVGTTKKSERNRSSGSRSGDHHHKSTKSEKKGSRERSSEKKTRRKSRSRSKSRDRRREARNKKHGSREKSHEKSRSRRSKSRESKRLASRSHSRDTHRRHTSRSHRSPSPSRPSHQTSRRSRSRSHTPRSRHHRSHSRSAHSASDRSRSRSVEKKSRTAARLNIDKEKLREIAIKNAYGNMPLGAIPLPENRPAAATLPKTRGKSVKELTEFCKKIAEEPPSNADTSVEKPVDAELHEEDDSVFSASRLKAVTAASIIMNIRNAKQLPVMSAQEKAAKTVVLRTQFPVSSGNDHRSKESEWVPVTTTGASSISAAEDKVFCEPPSNPGELESIVGERVSALRKLKNNPHDKAALGTIFKVQQQMKQWAEVELPPGQFLGSTGVQTLTPEELGTEDRRFQAWAKKDTFTRAAPLTGGIGKVLLERMGWKAGTGLGKHREGITVPLSVDIKTDRRGLMSCGETSRKPAQPNVSLGNLTGKHPVSVLNEMCSKRHWQPPRFELMEEVGPAHHKMFRFKVILNNVEYQPGVGSNNKKTAKLQAAQLCLEKLGLL